MTYVESDLHTGLIPDLVKKLPDLPLDSQVESQFNPKPDKNGKTPNVKSLFEIPQLEDFLKIPLIREIAPSWVNIDALKQEIGKLNSRVFWHELLNRTAQSKVELDGYLWEDDIPFESLEQVAEFVKGNNNSGYNLATQTAILSALLGEYSLYMLTQKGSNSLAYNIVIEYGLRTNTVPSTSSLELINRMKYIFPANIEDKETILRQPEPLSTYLDKLKVYGKDEVSHQFINLNYFPSREITNTIFSSFGNLLQDQDYQSYFKNKITYSKQIPSE